MFDLMPFRFNDWERKFFPDFFNEEFFNRDIASFRTDISDTGKEYLIEAELPGFDKEDITVEVKEDRLTIAATKESNTEERKDNYLRKERRTGSVMRSFALDGVDRDRIRAEFKNGVLKLALPKAEEVKNPVRRIDIN
ncbi:HSP20 family protein [Hydrogenispora ethanolica]|jgi:HSP20 family protein|uniref:HSP20 family protein n=1 Tax=Hydrogenispora ethanolica TaxID=1082276 RepID=A0A4R1S031_HYDET|nr:Hsp20/alpha crystallin family protein [Hydrogenispora ethanolica]TCL72416.1 HSP20 family protein [Hydrogenispora ethanolica]